MQTTVRYSLSGFPWGNLLRAAAQATAAALNAQTHLIELEQEQMMSRKGENSFRLTLAHLDQVLQHTKEVDRQIGFVQTEVGKNYRDHPLFRNAEQADAFVEDLIVQGVLAHREVFDRVSREFARGEGFAGGAKAFLGQLTTRRMAIQLSAESAIIAVEMLGPLIKPWRLRGSKHLIDAKAAVSRVGRCAGSLHQELDVATLMFDRLPRVPHHEEATA